MNYSTFLINILKRRFSTRLKVINASKEPINNVSIGGFIKTNLIQASDPKFSSLELIPKGIFIFEDFVNSILDKDGEYLRIPLVWLKDHCRSPINYNWSTNQRRSNCVDIFKNANVNSR